MNIREFQDVLGYHFKDEHLLIQALSHRSYVFEHNNGGDNQRLEFLGDAILDFLIAEILYKQYPEKQEGDLSRIRSRLVCEPTLCILAQKLDFESQILMGKGEISAGGLLRPGTLADAYEAVIGAIYLDGGMDAVKAFILSHHAEFLKDPDGDWLAIDAKTKLQECAQSKHLSVRYEVLTQTGPLHAPVFEVGVFIDENCIGKGTGHNKKEAQQAAASDALKRWKS